MDDSIGGPCQNTDRELWRERPDDYYADSIHVTEGGGIGMNCGGIVIVLPIRAWHALASEGISDALNIMGLKSMVRGVVDESNRLIAPPQPTTPARPSGPWDGNKAP